LELAVSKVETMDVVLLCNICRSDRIQDVDTEFNFRRCGCCGYVFDSPRPSAAAVAAFYSQPAKYDVWLAEEQARDLLWKRRLKKLLRHSVQGSLLDIGTGIGQFLHHAQPFFTQVSGTEISESAIRIAKEKYGLDLFAGRAEELDLPLNSFDNITLFHVLEHVADPVRLIARCRDLLSDQGTLAIAVPNDVLAWSSSWKRFGKKLGLRAFHKFSPVLGISRAGTAREIQLSHFTPRVLRQLLEASRFTVLEESLDPYYASAGMRRVIDTIYYALHHALYAALKINRYDTIWMVARKS